MSSNTDTVRKQLAAEVAAATRILVAEKILDYSGHVSTRLPLYDVQVRRLAERLAAVHEARQAPVVRRVGGGEAA